MDSENPPKLPHGIPSPETYLPGTPEWFWWLLAVGGAVVLLLLLWLVRLVKPEAPPPRPIERDLFVPALKALDELRGLADQQPVSEIAAGASLVIRTYLADDRSEPALYETVEEFEARQSELPSETNRLLNELNEAKYSKSEAGHDRSIHFVERARDCLKELHARPVPAPEKPDTPEPAPEPWKRVSRWSMVMVPLALITAVTTFLFGVYDGRDTGGALAFHPTTFIALGAGAVALLVHLFTRPQS